MALIGKEVFHEYRKAKRQFKDFNEWCAEAIRDEFGVELEAPLMAAKICATTRHPWENPVVFENIALVLNGREALPDIEQDISVKEIAFAVNVLKSEFPNEEFNDSVCQYFAAEAGEEGMTLLPKEIKVAERFIPTLYLTPEQQDIQEAYLDECNDYIKTMNDAAVINTTATFDEVVEV